MMAFVQSLQAPKMRGGRFLETGEMEEARRSAPLFETTTAAGRGAYRAFAASMLVSICLVWAYRATHMPYRSRNGEKGGEELERWWWVWIGLFASELWFGFYWILTQSIRWNPIYHSTFKDRLSQRYGEEELPYIDVFVCTTKLEIEPPSLVMSTVLSVVAYDYPSSKLAIYLSDDGGSNLTFYALIEASNFAKHWLPFCQKFKVEPQSPAAYFSKEHHLMDPNTLHEWHEVKGLYEEMVQRIDEAVKLGHPPEDMKEYHKGFKEWSPNIKSYDHQPIVQVINDGRRSVNNREEALQLPTLVYMSREKKPHCCHNFKAGSLNALIRVSSEISNGDFILNVDCDMFSSNSQSIRDALCFFLDEERGHQIAFVQYPQTYHNLTRNDMYASGFKVLNKIGIPSIDGLGGVPYIGTGCFHRRECLCGVKYIPKNRACLKKATQRSAREGSFKILEDRAKEVATCNFEENTSWGREVGLKYGCSAEDVLTGMSIHCRGWKSVYFNPSQKAFLGVAPMSLGETLVQHQRWSEGLLQIFLSKYCPFLYGHGKISIGRQMGYSIFNLWAVNSFPTLFYVIIPPLALLQGISLYPKISSIWFLPFAYVILAKHMCCLGESLYYGDTLKGWWNIQRMWLLKRITSYLFGTIDFLLNNFEFSKTKFKVTSKVADDEVLERLEKETMDFTATPLVFINIITTIALFNWICLIGGLKKVVEKGIQVETLFLQFCSCGIVVLLNLPIYKAMLFRRDSGGIPIGTTLISMVLVGLGLLMATT